MTSTNDGKEVEYSQTSIPKGRSYYIKVYKLLDAALTADGTLRERTEAVCNLWAQVHSLCTHSAPSTHPHLLQWVQRHTATTILKSEWRDPDSADLHNDLKQYLQVFITEAQAASADRSDWFPWETLLISRAEWFIRVIPDPWGHAVLRRLLDPGVGPPCDDKDVIQWLKEETGIVLVCRLRQLAVSKQCTDLALSLATAVMERKRGANDKEKINDSGGTLSFEDELTQNAGFTTEVWETLGDIEFVLLHKLGKTSNCIQLAKVTPLVNSYKLIERLRTRLETSPSEKKLWKNAKDVALLIAEVVVTRCMVCEWGGSVGEWLWWASCAVSRLVPPALRPATAAALAAPALSSHHLHVFARAMETQCTEDMMAFVVELYVRAITAGMNELEKLKLNNEKEVEARVHSRTLCNWFQQLSTVVKKSPRLSAECTLTAFSVFASPQLYEKLKAQPVFPPPLKVPQAVTQTPSSSFGSWANDSRSQTNFVKTSETLNLEYLTGQTSVLSTAILNEGANIGLSPELCQDLAVLLSGPRVKTLTWDMDRDKLLEHCRVYMERTKCGTKSLQTELRYLNLDPSQYQHLPEEEDEDEDDIYYGIEKGYEHLVEVPPPELPKAEEIWTGFKDTQSSESEHEIMPSKIRHALVSSNDDDDEDPLSLEIIAARCKKSRKKEKDQRKEHSKSIENKTGKKDKKVRKKQNKKSSTKSSLGKSDTQKQIKGNTTKTNVTDSDYDSQGISSLASMTPEANVEFDGLFSMEDLNINTPTEVPQFRQEQIKNTATEKKLPKPRLIKKREPKPKDQVVKEFKQGIVPKAPKVKHCPENEKVRNSINKLLMFRKQRNNALKTGSVPVESKAHQNTELIDKKIVQSFDKQMSKDIQGLPVKMGVQSFAQTSPSIVQNMAQHSTSVIKQNPLSLQTVTKQTLPNVQTNFVALSKGESITEYIKQLQAAALEKRLKCDNIGSQEMIVKPQQPIAKPQQPIVKSQQSIVKSQQPIVKSQQTIVKSQLPIVKSPQPIIKSQQSIVKPQQPIVKSQQPFVKSQQPIVKSPQPIVESHQPMVKSQPPIVNSQQPIVTQELIVRSQQQVVNSQQPIVYPQATMIQRIDTLYTQQQLLNKFEQQHTALHQQLNVVPPSVAKKSQMPVKPAPKVEPVLNTFSRLSYMHKNKQVEPKKTEQQSQFQAFSDELERRISAYKLHKHNMQISTTQTSMPLQSIIDSPKFIPDTNNMKVRNDPSLRTMLLSPTKSPSTPKPTGYQQSTTPTSPLVLHQLSKHLSLKAATQSVHSNLQIDKKVLTQSDQQVPSQAYRSIEESQNQVVNKNKQNLPNKSGNSQLNKDYYAKLLSNNFFDKLSSCGKDKNAVMTNQPCTKTRPLTATYVPTKISTLEKQFNDNQKKESLQIVSDELVTDIVINYKRKNKKDSATVLQASSSVRQDLMTQNHSKPVVTAINPNHIIITANKASGIVTNPVVNKINTTKPDRIIITANKASGNVTNPVVNKINTTKPDQIIITANKASGNVTNTVVNKFNTTKLDHIITANKASGNVTNPVVNKINETKPSKSLKAPKPSKMLKATKPSRSLKVTKPSKSLKASKPSKSKAAKPKKSNPKTAANDFSSSYMAYLNKNNTYSNQSAKSQLAQNKIVYANKNIEDLAEPLYIHNVATKDENQQTDLNWTSVLDALRATKTKKENEMVTNMQHKSEVTSFMKPTSNVTKPTTSITKQKSNVTQQPRMHVSNTPGKILINKYLDPINQCNTSNVQSCAQKDKEDEYALIDELIDEDLLQEINSSDIEKPVCTEKFYQAPKGSTSSPFNYNQMSFVTSASNVAQSYVPPTGHAVQQYVKNTSLEQTNSNILLATVPITKKVVIVTPNVVTQNRVYNTEIGNLINNYLVNNNQNVAYKQQYTPVLNQLYVIPKAPQVVVVQPTTSTVINLPVDSTSVINSTANEQVIMPTKIESINIQPDKEENFNNVITIPAESNVLMKNSNLFEQTPNTSIVSNLNNNDVRKTLDTTPICKDNLTEFYNTKTETKPSLQEPKTNDSQSNIGNVSRDPEKVLPTIETQETKTETKPSLQEPKTNDSQSNIGNVSRDPEKLLPTIKTQETKTETKPSLQEPKTNDSQSNIGNVSRYPKKLLPSIESQETKAETKPSLQEPKTNDSQSNIGNVSKDPEKLLPAIETQEKTTEMSMKEAVKIAMDNVKKEEHLQIKRNKLLNRKIHHFSTAKAIVLDYQPIAKVIPKYIDIKERRRDKSKSNKGKVISEQPVEYRRILLRSSNSLYRDQNITKEKPKEVNETTKVEVKTQKKKSKPLNKDSIEESVINKLCSSPKPEVMNTETDLQKQNLTKALHKNEIKSDAEPTKNENEEIPLLLECTEEPFEPIGYKQPANQNAKSLTSTPKLIAPRSIQQIEQAERDKSKTQVKTDEDKNKILPSAKDTSKLYKKDRTEEHIKENTNKTTMSSSAHRVTNTTVTNRVKTSNSTKTKVTQTTSQTNDKIEIQKTKIVGDSNCKGNNYFDIEDVKIINEEMFISRNRNRTEKHLTLRIPNGKTIKVRVSGEKDFDMDTVLNDPTLKDYIYKSFIGNQQFKLEVKAGQEGMKIKEQPKPAETINLLSDDEEQSFAKPDERHNKPSNLSEKREKIEIIPDAKTKIYSQNKKNKQTTSKTDITKNDDSLTIGTINLISDDEEQSSAKLDERHNRPSNLSKKRKRIEIIPDLKTKIHSQNKEIQQTTTKTDITRTDDTFKTSKKKNTLETENQNESVIKDKGSDAIVENNTLNNVLLEKTSENEKSKESCRSKALNVKCDDGRSYLHSEENKKVVSILSDPTILRDSITPDLDDRAMKKIHEPHIVKGKTIPKDVVKPDGLNINEFLENQVKLLEQKNTTQSNRVSITNKPSCGTINNTKRLLKDEMKASAAEIHKAVNCKPENINTSEVKTKKISKEIKEDVKSSRKIICQVKEETIKTEIPTMTNEQRLLAEKVVDKKPFSLDKTFAMPQVTPKIAFISTDIPKSVKQVKSEFKSNNVKDSNEFEIINLEDSSDDEFAQGKNNVIDSLKKDLIKDIIPLIKPSTEINNLKNKLLEGIIPDKKDTGKKHTTAKDKSDPKLSSKCFVNLTRCDELVQKYASVRNSCFISLINCDDIVVLDSDTEEIAVERENKVNCDNSRSESPSILDLNEEIEIPVNDVPKSPTVQVCESLLEDIYPNNLENVLPTVERCLKRKSESLIVNDSSETDMKCVDKSPKRLKSDVELKIKAIVPELASDLCVVKNEDSPAQIVSKTESISSLDKIQSDTVLVNASDVSSNKTIYVNSTASNKIEDFLENVEAIAPKIPLEDQPVKCSIPIVSEVESTTTLTTASSIDENVASPKTVATVDVKTIDLVKTSRSLNKDIVNDPTCQSEETKKDHSVNCSVCKTTPLIYATESTLKDDKSDKKEPCMEDNSVAYKSNEPLVESANGVISSIENRRSEQDITGKNINDEANQEVKLDLPDDDAENEISNQSQDVDQSKTTKVISDEKVTKENIIAETSSSFDLNTLVVDANRNKPMNYIAPTSEPSKVSLSPVVELDRCVEIMKSEKTGISGAENKSFDLNTPVVDANQIKIIDDITPTKQFSNVSLSPFLEFDRCVEIIKSEKTGISEAENKYSKICQMTDEKSKMIESSEVSKPYLLIGLENEIRNSIAPPEKLLECKDHNVEKASCANFEKQLTETEKPSAKIEPSDAYSSNEASTGAENDVNPSKDTNQNISEADGDTSDLSTMSKNFDEILNVAPDLPTRNYLSNIVTNENLECSETTPSIDQEIQADDILSQSSVASSISIGLSQASSDSNIAKEYVVDINEAEKLSSGCLTPIDEIPGLVIPGIEVIDPDIGKCYIFRPIFRSENPSPLSEPSSFNDRPTKCDDLNISPSASPNAHEVYEVYEIIDDENESFNNTINIPTKTYSSNSINTRKRLHSGRDFQASSKKYRKGKNIDYPKMTLAAINQYTYKNDYKRVIEYIDKVKFSFASCFHREYIDVQELQENWPKNCKTNDKPIEKSSDDPVCIFNEELSTHSKMMLSFIDSTLDEEIKSVSIETEIPSTEEPDNNFSMGFGERSGRVIQNLNQRDNFTISAATLSDVKQYQPSQCENLTDIKIRLINIQNELTYQMMLCKVKLFFDNYKVTCYTNAIKIFEQIPGLYETAYMQPVLRPLAVNVVQVGQLPVSTATQNLVTCDPRVTHVSDVNPSQCSVESSPQSHDNHQTNIKAEYTELTTADLSLTLQNMSNPNDAPNEVQNKNIITEQNVIPTHFETESKAPSMNDCNAQTTNDNTSSDVSVNNLEYQYETNGNNAKTSLVADSTQVIYTTSTFKEIENQRKSDNSPEKTDQIAHAMNAAGITTSETPMTTRSQSFMNIISQKVIPQPLNTLQANNNYPKSTAINAISLQQALAQILPPPLNQTNNGDGNSQQNATPQVLHIVHSKNTSSNQITLLDNSQQSVLSGSNATQVLHIVQNKGPITSSQNNVSPQQTTFSGLSLVDAGLQQAGNQLLHIVNTGAQKTNNAGQLLKRVNLLTNLTNVQGGNEQKMVQFVCKSADGKSIHLNAPHQRSMVLRLQPIETPVQPPTTKATEQTDAKPGTPNTQTSAKDEQEIKSRSIYEENYAKFIQHASTKPQTPGTGEKGTSLPKFNQAFGKPVFQDEAQKQNDLNEPSVQNAENSECRNAENPMNIDHISQIGSPPLLLRKQPVVTSQAQPSIVQQIKQTIAPMNIQTMHGGVIYTRQIPVNLRGGQTINLITVPSTEMVDESGQKQPSEVKFITQNEGEPSIIKIVPQTPAPNAEVNQEDGTAHMVTSEGSLQPQPVLTQMRIKLPMLSKAPQVVSGARVVRPSFFQIQRNVIGGANQSVYQQLVLTAAPSLGQQTIRLPQAQTRIVKGPTETQTSESQLSTSTLEQLREFDMVLEQVKERSTVQPGASPSYAKSHSTDTTDGASSSSSTHSEQPQQIFYSIGNNQTMNVAYINRKATVTTSTANFVRSPDSSVADSPPSTSGSQVSHDPQNSNESQSKPARVGSKSVRSRPTKPATHAPSAVRVNHTIPPKTSTQKPLEDEQTTQRILYILAEYKEQVQNSPDKDKPAPRRRSNPPSSSGSSKRKKSSSGSRKPGCTRDHSPLTGDEASRTMGSEDSSCGTSQGDCTESCSMDTHSPQDSPRKVARKLFEPESQPANQPRLEPQRNVIVADGQTITVARSATGKPTTAVLMPANYILPVSMVKGGQQIAIVTNRGPKLLTVGGTGESGAANALFLQRLIGPGGLKPVLARPGVRHVRLPTAALQNLQAFNLAASAPQQQADSTASPASAPTPDLVDTRANSSPWTESDAQSDVKMERGSSPEGSEPWNLPSSSDRQDYSYEDNANAKQTANRTVLDSIPDRYSPDAESQRIFDKMFEVDKKSYIVEGHDDLDASHSDCDDKVYNQVVHNKDGSTRSLHRVAQYSAAALRHKYAILEHELRLQKSLSEECEDLGVDSPSASELFPEAELLFAASPADHDGPHHTHPAQPSTHQSAPPHQDPAAEIDQQLAPRCEPHDLSDVGLDLDDDGIVTVSEDGLQAIALDQEEFARSHPNTTFHSEPTDVGVQPFSLSSSVKSRHINPAVYGGPPTVLMTPATVLDSHTRSNHTTHFDMDHIAVTTHNNRELNLSSVLVKDDRLTRFDNILTDSRELHLSNTASAIVHPGSNATQVIRRVCYDDDKRDRFLMDDSEIIAGDDAKMAVAEDSSRDATLGSIGEVDDCASSPERHAELFWESNSASVESRRPLDFSSDSDKCCKSPSLDETNSTDSSGVGTQMRLDSVIKEARARARSASACSSVDETIHPPIRTYPPKRSFHTEEERSLSGKTRAGESSPDNTEVRRRASSRGVVKRGCHCCNGSPAPQRPKKQRQRKPTLDFTTNN